MSSGSSRPFNPRKVCFEFSKSGRCKFGSKCKFEHRKGNSSTQGTSGSKSKNNNNGSRVGSSRQRQKHLLKDKDSERFVKYIATLKPTKLADELERSSSVWFKAWNLHETFDHQTLACLVESLARIPGSSSIEAPPSNLCKKIIFEFLEKSKQSDEKILKATETVSNCAVRLMQFEWEEPRESVRAALTDILLNAEGILKKQNKDHRLMSQSLLKHVEDLERPWRITVKETDIEVDEHKEGEQTYDLWRKGTIAWLSTAEFFAPSHLPVMKVPGGSSNGVYGSKEEYINTVYRLWVGMTFADGHSSLSARCHSRCNKGSCQLTLWPISESHAVSTMRCKTFNCNEPVEFACRMKKHDSMCRKCINNAQVLIRGEPGPKASTHIYDGDVATYDADGKLFIENVKSRNPPQHDIHWRSTKRLSCPSLVGIVKLNSSGGILKLSDEIFWGELSFHSKPQEEHFKRVDGKVKVDMAAVCDNHYVNFQNGDPICIIDCMVFCPEWIPVLQALEKQSKLPLPFSDGHLLNLCSSKPADMSNCIMYNGNATNVDLSNIPHLIESMILESSLEPIRAIRQNAQTKSDLVKKLTDLAKCATLDKMQLISFLDGLRNPVHLTQGPPGTGKSYLGVVMVRALIIIRDIWLKVSPSIGTPPILVLSYKNHAIDEFLNDLIVAMPRRSLFNKLIRIGGQCKDTRLEPYSERHACKSDLEVNKKKKVLEDLHKLRNGLQRLVSKGRVFQSYRIDVFGSDDEVNQRNALNEATKIVLESLVRVERLKPTLECLAEKSPKGVTEELHVSLSGIEKGNLSPKEITHMIGELVNEVEHYNFPHPGDLVYEWIRGLKPLSRCSFVMKNSSVSNRIQCEKLSQSNFPQLCILHQCRFIDNGTRCGRQVKDHERLFCGSHSCQIDSCNNYRVDTKQKFCQNHCCKRCLELGVLSNAANEEPPRNVCDEHPLCCNLDCLNFSTPNDFFCEDHKIKICRAITKRGNKCTNKSISRSILYCRDHLNKQTSSIKNATEDALSSPVLGSSNLFQPVRCTATTKKGKPCKGWAAEGSEFCNDHLPQASTIHCAKKSSQPASSVIGKTWKELTTVDQPSESLETAPINVPEALPTSKKPAQLPHLAVDQEVNKIKGLAKVKNDGESPLEFALRVGLCLPVNQAKDAVPVINDDCKNASTEFLNDAKDRNPGDSQHDISGMLIDSEYTESDEEDINDEAEYLRHLRDVFEVKSDDEDSILCSEEGSLDILDDIDDDLVDEDFVHDTKRWDWNMSLDERWKRCQALMNHEHKMLITALNIVSKAILRGRGDLKVAKVRANAKVYENRSVIGGTMVGCIARLDAIRSTNPFAIVVEEASEVLEPLLFSCLCSSTCKLEMIGDHLQLQPSTMNRFDFEVYNKTNISMFQRLIQAPAGNQVPSAVLSTQRRMRPEICDLTRDYYKDIIAIDDHPITKTRKIGEKVKNPYQNQTKMIKKTETQGRKVPGVSPNIYLWTHIGKQEKARVGLSRINETEAEMICSLATYLVICCGVPRQSIAILTPYKGQLMLIREKLIKDKKYKQYQLIPRDSVDTCRLSTVDRFQGDEEDIVLISLVVDSESRTPFVRLVNRMIVLLSRSRIGVYIVGNVGYFDNNRQGLSPHWSSLLQQLKDSPRTEEGEETYSESRVGQSFPLCCPIHRENVMQIQNPQDLKLGFCTTICQQLLPCGHGCGQQCHWPRLEHNQNCEAMVESPCKIHPGMISCVNLYANCSQSSFKKQRLNHEEVKAFYQCPKKVTFLLPCGHEIIIPCWGNQDILNKRREPPKCKKKSSTPYFYQSCKHILDVTCDEYSRYNSSPNLAPPCNEEVEYIPPCGHALHKMSCHKAERFTKDSNLFQCHQHVSMKLPRCGHGAKVQCSISQILETWEGQRCDIVGEIHQEMSYGPKDFPCKENVTFVKKCGHKEKMKCENAFAMTMTRSSMCKELVKTQNRYCGHDIEVFCHEEEKMSRLPIPNVITEYFEDSIAPYPSSIPRRKKCNVEVVLHRNCGHDFTCKCGSVHEPCPACKVPVVIKSPLCNHAITVPCHMKDISRTQIWNDIALQLIQSGKKVSLDGLFPINAPLDSFSADQKSILCTCDESLTFSLSCGHDIILPCSELLSLLFNPSLLKCREKVCKPLKCGHMLLDECWRFQKYQDGKLELKCNKELERDCWNIANCSNQLPIICSKDGSGILACGWATTWTCVNGNHCYEIHQCTKGVPQTCPGCEESYFEREMKKLPTIQSYVDNSFKLNKIQWKPCTTDFDKFAMAETSMYDNFLTYQQIIPLWKREISRPLRFPVFKVVKKQFDSLNHKDQMIRPSLLGLGVDVLNEHNIQILRQIHGADKVSILVGIASAIRVHIRKGQSPFRLKNKKRKTLVETIQKEGYDTIVFQDTDRSGLECVLIQDPYPMVAYCFMKGTIDELKAALPALPTHSLLDFEPRKITFTKPKGQIKKISKEAFDAKIEINNNQMLPMHIKKDISKMLKGTEFEGLRACERLYSKDDPLGIFDLDLKKEVKQDLLKKMTVTNQNAPPFQGINLLESLAETLSPKSIILKLCLSLESSSIDRSDASRYLKEYLADSGDIFHPFALLAASRCLNNPSQNLLQAFEIVHDNAKDYMTKHELSLLYDSEMLENDTETSIVDRWQELKEEFPDETKSESMETLLSLTGLSKVKREAFEIYKSSLHIRQLSDEIQEANRFAANFCFLGNPGTGKTTVARLFAEILQDAGIRENSNFIETTAQTCKDNGMDEFRKVIKSAMGGVLFIDEAYDLDPVGDFKGKPVVNEILTLSENKRDEISIILAGYEDDFNKKFFAYNDGLRSRFHSILFEDFNEGELSEIWNKMREGKMWKEEENVGKVLISRMVKSGGRKGFGNAREVRKQLERAIKTAMSRLGSDLCSNNMILLVSDVIGENPIRNDKIAQVMDAVNEKIGWTNIKTAFMELIQLCSTNYCREVDGLPPLEVFFNRMFLGNPGTGKTTCGKLYGQLLKHLGFLSIGDVVVKTASDFVGQYIGQSQTKTNVILDGAKGKVLIIDEAYALDDNLYGKQVLDTLVEKVQGSPGDDIAVLLLGYEEPMLSMLRNQNPGLTRRFPKEYAFYFDDYDDAQLLTILKLNIEKLSITGSTKFQRRALEILRSQREQANFGNAGAVELLLKSAMQKMAQRQGSARLEESDLDELCRNDFEGADADPLELLDTLYKMDGVKRKLEQLRDAFIVAKREGENKPDVGHFVFTGSPGTGKTTVARSIAKILYGLGLIPTKNIVETSGLDLTGDFVGHTKTKVTEILREAKGGILFIDEAYNLGFGMYGKEACDTIVAAMTSEEYKDLVVVIAGYEADIDNMLNGNAGLKSRFTQYFNFPDWDSNDAVMFFTSLATKNNFSLDAGVLDELHSGIPKLIALEGWGNGRDIVRIWKSSLTHRASRVAKDTTGIDRCLKKDDVIEAMKELFTARKPKSKKLMGGGASILGGNELQAMEEVNSCRDELLLNDEEASEWIDLDDMLTNEEDNEESNEKDQKISSTNGSDSIRDEGVPDEIWDELERSKCKEEEEKERLKRQEEEYNAFLEAKKEEERLALIAFEQEMERIRIEQEEAARLEAERKLQEEEERRRELLRAEQRRREEEERERLEKLREKERIQEKLRRLRLCPAGFQWYQTGGGWRCGGGSHFVSDAKLQRSFTE